MSADYPRLSQTDLRRLKILASAAERTPRAMLRFVLRDGFAETERVVRRHSCRTHTPTRGDHEHGGSNSFEPRQAG